MRIGYNVCRIGCFLVMVNSVAAVDFLDFGQTTGEKIPLQIRRGKIAVVRFEVPDSDKAGNIGKTVSSEIATYLIRNGSTVFEREDLAAILKEKELQQKGVLKSKDKSLQSSEQVDFVITGSLYRLDNNHFRVTTKVIDIKTLAILFSDEETMTEKPMAINVQGYHRHDGFYYNLSMGFGYQNIGITDYESFNSLGLRGSTMVVETRIGWSLNEKLAASLSVNSMAIGAFGSPTLFADPGIVTETTDKTKSLNMQFTGPALTYYTSDNYFVNASVGAASVFYRDASKRITVDNGFGLSLSGGKEWWVSENWGIGLYAQFSYSRVELTKMDMALTTTRGTISDSNFTVSSWAVTIGVSATYN